VSWFDSLAANRSDKSLQLSCKYRAAAKIRRRRGVHATNKAPISPFHGKNALPGNEMRSTPN